MRSSSSFILCPSDAKHKLQIDLSTCMLPVPAGVPAENREAGDGPRPARRRPAQARLPLQEEPLQEEVLRVLPGAEAGAVLACKPMLPKLPHRGKEDIMSVKSVFHCWLKCRLASIAVCTASARIATTRKKMAFRHHRGCQKLATQMSVRWGLTQLPLGNKIWLSIQPWQFNP